MKFPRIARRGPAPVLAAGTLAVAGLVTAATATVQPSTPIRHVVVIDMENHSFDNVLGYWCDSHPRRCPDGGMPSSVTLSNGAVVIPGTSPDIVPKVSHSTSDQVNAMDGGRMDGWWKIAGCAPTQNYSCIAGYQPGQIPNMTQLARDFAISDMTFSMQDSPSWFGHLYAVAATTDGFTVGTNPANAPKPGFGWGCDSGKTSPWAGAGTVQNVPACIPDPALTGPRGTPLANGGAFEPSPVPYVPTIMDRLDAAGLPWRIYGARCTAESVSAKGLETCTASNGQYVWSSCASFAECLYTPQNANLVPNSRFIPDATSGNLPAFSLITAGNFVDSEHNGASMTTGDNWLGQTISAVMNGPDWASTAIFITFDDCGCFYDQVPPGTNPDGTRQGPRVPLIIVSPYARPGYTDTTPATFASILAYVEHTFKLAPLGRNDAHAYDFAQAFNYSHALLKPTRMVARPLPPSARHIRLTPALLNDPS